MSRAVAQVQPLTDARRIGRRESVITRSWLRLADLPTMVAVGPFDDPGHARQLAAAFLAVQQTCPVQLVLLGTGAHRSAVVRRATEHGLQKRLRLVEDSSGPRWASLLAVADLVIPSPACERSTLLEVMAAGRAVVAPASPATALLVVPGSAGLLYRPGDVSAMTAALLRLLTKPALRHEMADRASQVARRHHTHVPTLHHLAERNHYA
jgi:glycosyltransferase involved in cell wall biosynthesis